MKRFTRILDNIVRKIFYLFPIQKNYILLESEGDYWDNARAFYEYLIKNNYNEKYKIIWIVKEPNLYPKQKNVVFVSRHSLGINLKADYYISRSACILFTHPGWLKSWRKNQTVINLTHSSMTFKSGKNNDLSPYSDYVLFASQLVKEVKMKAWSINEEQSVILGGPRIDLLYGRKNSINKIIPDYKDEKLILSMSTFRQTNNWKDSDFIDKFSINVINDQEDLDELNNFLKEEKMYILIKIHHLQDLSVINLDRLDHIIYLEDRDLQEKGIQLYELLGEADALMTDYSSVFYDYLLLDRPIGFLVADMADYSRGFVMDKPKEEMVGDKIKNKKQLYEFLASVNTGVDLYKKDREIIRNRVHDYQDNHNSERLLEWLVNKNIIGK